MSGTGPGANLLVIHIILAMDEKIWRGLQIQQGSPLGEVPIIGHKMISVVFPASGATVATTSSTSVFVFCLPHFLPLISDNSVLCYSEKKCAKRKKFFGDLRVIFLLRFSVTVISGQ